MTVNVRALRARLEEAEELLKAIRTGAVDALVVSGPLGDQIYTLSGAEHPYRVMVESMSEGAIMTTADDTIFYANHSFARMIALPLEQVIGSAMKHLVCPEDAGRYAALIDHAHHGASRGAIRLSTAGAVILTHLSVSPFDSAGSTCFSVVVTDLTEHQRHEELLAAQALERSKRADAEATRQRVQTVLESITDSFFAIDRAWRITDVNHRAAAAFGRPGGDLVGKSFWEVTSRDHPEIDEQYRIAMARRVTVHYEGRSLIAPGKWFEKHIYPTDAGLAIYFRDITERKRAEDQLRQSEAHFNEAQHLGHVGSWIWDVATGDLAWSLEHYRLFGVDPDTFRPTQDNAQRLIHGDDRPIVEAVLEDAIRHSREFEVEYRLIRSDGSVRHHHALGRPQVSEAGAVKTFIGTVIDVTERKEAERALRESEVRFRRYFELGLIGMAMTSPSAGILDVNDELCRILGYRRDELLGRQWPDLTHPDDLAADLTQFNRVMSGEIDGYSLDKRWIRKDGHVIFSIMAAKCVRRADGSVDYFVGMVQDITGRKVAEDKVRRSEAILAEGQRLSQTGSWVLSLRTGELSWSREHYRLWGLSPDTFEPSLASTRLAILAADRDAAVDEMDRAICERTGFHCEFRIVRSDGSVRHVLSVGQPVFNDSGRCEEYVGTVMDVTDRKAEEAARQELRRQLIAAQEDERRRIALEMHDQFGQQLSALVLKMSELRRDIGRRVGLVRELESLEDIAKQLDRDLEHIVCRLRPTALDDLGLVAALTEYVKQWSELFHVPAELHTSGTDSDRLGSEFETALYRMIQEALNNVAKHARAKHVSVLIDQRCDRVSVIVEDDGVGFDPQRPSARFGLAGMRDRARLLGGMLDVESRPGTGTTVVARIPLKVAPHGGPGGQSPNPAG